LDAAGSRLERLTVTGSGRVADAKPVPGGLQSLVGRNIDLTYQPGRGTLDHVRVVGAGRLTMAAQRGPGSEIAADSIAIGMASDGATPTTLDASARVTVSLPTDASGAGAPKRTVAADEMTSRSEDGNGLNRARFEGNVVFRERGGVVDRTARAGVLDVAVSAGLGSVDDARFSRNVRFEDGPLTAEGPEATYLVSQGSLSLRRGGAGTEGAVPHLKNDRISVSALELEVVLDGPGIEAKGDVKSEIRPAGRRAGGQGDGPKAGSADITTKMPSMLKSDQPVSIAAGALSYDGKASGATYRGGAQLWQGDTTIRAVELVLDGKTGDLTATGSVATSIGLRTTGQSAQTASAQPADGPRRTRSTATAQRLGYEEGTRRATYTGQAHMTGEQGDMTANKIELYLKSSGDEVDRLEAYEAVTLRDHDRRTTGSRLTYVADGERYVVTGSPVTILDECDRETVGRTLTFDRVTDKMVVDGSERARTRTKGRSNCQ
jgi:lipopolysaccharide export system protein LptA